MWSLKLLTGDVWLTVGSRPQVTDGLLGVPVSTQSVDETTTSFLSTGVTLQWTTVSQPTLLIMYSHRNLHPVLSLGQVPSYFAGIGLLLGDIRFSDFFVGVRYVTGCCPLRRLCRGPYPLSDFLGGYQILSLSSVWRVRVPFGGKKGKRDRRWVDTTTLQSLLPSFFPYTFLQSTLFSPRRLEQRRATSVGRYRSESTFFVNLELTLSS